MTIETMYNVGDDVWFGSLGFSKSATISEIKIYVMIDGYIRIEYHIEKNGYCWIRNEHEIFSTKEELIRTLHAASLQKTTANSQKLMAKV